MSAESALHPKISLTGTREPLPRAQEEVEAEGEAEAEAEAEAEGKLLPSSEILASDFPDQDKPDDLQATLDHTGHPSSKSRPNVPNASAAINAKGGRTLALQSSLPGKGCSLLPPHRAPQSQRPAPSRGGMCGGACSHFLPGCCSPAGGGLVEAGGHSSLLAEPKPLPSHRCREQGVAAELRSHVGSSPGTTATASPDAGWTLLKGTTPKGKAWGRGPRAHSGFSFQVGGHHFLGRSCSAARCLFCTPGSGHIAGQLGSPRRPLQECLSLAGGGQTSEQCSSGHVCPGPSCLVAAGCSPGARGSEASQEPRDPFQSPGLLLQPFEYRAVPRRASCLPRVKQSLLSCRLPTLFPAPRLPG